MKALKRDKTPTPRQLSGTSEQDLIPLQESVQSQLQSSKKDTTPTPLQESVKRNQSQLQSSKKDKTPTPLQLLVKEMPGETVPHSQV